MAREVMARAVMARAACWETRSENIGGVASERFKRQLKDGTKAMRVMREAIASSVGKREHAQAREQVPNNDMTSRYRDLLTPIQTTFSSTLKPSKH